MALVKADYKLPREVLDAFPYLFVPHFIGEVVLETEAILRIKIVEKEAAESRDDKIPL